MPGCPRPTLPALRRTAPAVARGDGAGHRRRGLRPADALDRPGPRPGDDDPADPPRERALYVHGLGGASTNWTDLAGLLAVRFDGWALDLPGFGRSAPPPRGAGRSAGHVRAVVDVLEHIVDRPGAAPGGRCTWSATPSAGWSACWSPAAVPTWWRTLTLISPGDAGLPGAARRSAGPSLLLLLPGVPALASARMAGHHARAERPGDGADVLRRPAAGSRGSGWSEAVEEMRETTPSSRGPARR